MDGISDQLHQRYQQLRAMRDARQLSPEQFIAELQKLRWQDGDGAWRTISPEGVVLRFDGVQWIPVQARETAREATPNPPEVLAEAPLAPHRPAVPPPEVLIPAQPWSASPPAAVATTDWPRTSTSRFSSLVAASPILAIVPSLLCGSLWYLYTRTGPEADFDCITPLIVGGLPAFFWVFKKPIDKLLLPFKPAIQTFPKPLRLGVALAVPIVLGFACSLQSTVGYSGLQVASFISVMTAAVLLRF